MTLTLFHSCVLSSYSRWSLHVLTFHLPSVTARAGSQSPDYELYHQPHRGVKRVQVWDRWDYPACNGSFPITACQWNPPPPPPTHTHTNTPVHPRIHLINESRCCRQDCLLHWWVSKCGGRVSLRVWFHWCLIALKSGSCAAHTVCVSGCGGESDDR